MHYDDDHHVNLSEIAAAKVAAPRWGFVQSYNAQDHTAKVTLQPDGTLTDELPIAPMGGARYAPTQGQMAFLVPESQDGQAMIISGFAFNDLNPSPTNTPSNITGSTSPLQPGEWEVIGGQSQSLRMCADGTVLIQGAQPVKIKAPSVQLDGDLNVSGTISAHGDVVSSSGSLNDAIQELNQHEHDALTIGGPTTPTLPQFDVEPEQLPPVE